MRKNNTDKTMNVASIDIGTNTALLLIAEYLENGAITTVLDKQEIIRLGEGVDLNGVISPNAIERLIQTLRQYNDLIKKYDVARVFAVGTSALRDATNRTQVIDNVLQNTGIRICVIDGDTEAKMSFKGATFGLNPSGQILVLDIGGGSSEVIIGNLYKLLVRKSLNIGAVRITERYFKDKKTDKHTIAEATSFINRTISDFPFQTKDISLSIGVAGTVTTLAMLSLGLSIFDAKYIHGSLLPYSVVSAMSEQLFSINTEELVSKGVARQRADILPAGTLILKLLMEHLELSEIKTSIYGLRYGVLIELL